MSPNEGIWVDYNLQLYWTQILRPVNHQKMHRGQANNKVDILEMQAISLLG